MQTQITCRYVIEEEIEELGEKPLRRPPSGNWSTRQSVAIYGLARYPQSLIYPLYLSPPSSYSNKASRNRVLSSSPDLAASSIIRTYVFHMLRTYVMILYNWLIIWQNALYLYLGRSRMCLILQETCCSSLVLKPWRLDQETSEEKLFIKAGQIAQHLRTDSSTATR